MRQVGSYYWIRVNDGPWQVAQLAQVDEIGEHYEIIGSNAYHGATEVGPEIKGRG